MTQHLDKYKGGELTSCPRPRQPVVVITGNYGSGKTEVAVNWALALARGGETVTIVDLDIVNPYFRCREAEDLMGAEGIRVVSPKGEMHHAELPIILPEVQGVIAQPSGITILDVGGDDVGARVLASLKNAFIPGGYEMLQVVNERRPFTDTVEGCLRIQAEIEAASSLTVTGLISNAHLMDETTMEVVRSGADFAARVGQVKGQLLFFATAEERVLVEAESLADLASPVLVLDRLMLPPWRQPRGPESKLGRENFLLTAQDGAEQKRRESAS